MKAGGRADPCHRIPLGVVQRGRSVAVAFRDRHGQRLAAGGDPAAGEEFAHAPSPRRAELAERRRAQAFFVAFAARGGRPQGFEDRFAHAAAQARGILCQAFPRQRPAFLAARRLPPFAQGFRHRGNEDVADRVLVIVRRPADQSQQVRRQQRCIVEHLECGAQPAGRNGRTAFGAEQETDPPAASEGYEEAAACLQRPGTLGRQVVEGAGYRCCDSDFEDGFAGLTGGFTDYAVGGSGAVLRERPPRASQLSTDLRITH